MAQNNLPIAPNGPDVYWPSLRIPQEPISVDELARIAFETYVKNLYTTKWADLNGNEIQAWENVASELMRIIYQDILYKRT